jgi:hypothetical protein
MLGSDCLILGMTMSRGDVDTLPRMECAEAAPAAGPVAGPESPCKSSFRVYRLARRSAFS